MWTIEVSESDVVVSRATAERIETVRRAIGQLKIDAPVEVAEWLRRPWLAADDRASVERERALTARAIAEVSGDLRSLGRSEPLPVLVIGRGAGLVHRLPPVDAAAAMCQGIGLTGPTMVALDRSCLLAGAGVLLETQPDVAADLIRDALDLLGVVVVGRTGDADDARVQVEGVAAETKTPSDVRLDELTVLSAVEWSSSEISLSPGRSVDVGYGDGRGGQIMVGDGEIGAVLTIVRGHGPRRWARVPGSGGGLSALLRRSS